MTIVVRNVLKYFSLRFLSDDETLLPKLRCRKLTSIQYVTIEAKEHIVVFWSN